MIDLSKKLKEFSEQAKDDLVMNRDDRVLLVDGLNNYLRNFAGNPTLNDNGEHVGGFVGFLKSIAQAIRIVRPTRCVIVFDGKGGSQKRREIFTEYKENRKSMTRLNRTYEYNSIDDEVNNQRKQLIDLINALRYLPVTIISIDNVEADDVLAYLALLVKERGGKSIVMSNDKDFLQLVDDDITVYNPIKKFIYSTDTVIQEYGIHPTNFMIYRTLDGDESDNIPGVNGIGLKTLLKNFPELKTDPFIPWEHVFAKCEDILALAQLMKKSNAACQKILNGKDIIIRNMSLMRLDEQHMSGNARIKTLDQFDAPINKLNKLGLIQLLIHDRLIGAFQNIDEWVASTFMQLNRHAEK